MRPLVVVLHLPVYRAVLLATLGYHSHILSGLSTDGRQEIPRDSRVNTDIDRPTLSLGT